MIKVVEIKDKKSACFLKMRVPDDMRFAMAGVIRDEYEGDISAFFQDIVVSKLTEFYRENLEELEKRVASGNTQRE